MRRLPLTDPGTADHRTPGRFLWWMAKGQWRTLLLGMCFGIVWMSSQAVMPAVIGRAIDDGVTARDTHALAGWAGLLFAIGLVQAVSGILRHRCAVTNWLTAAYRTVQLVGRHAVRLGGSLPRRVSAGEVAAIGTSDISHLGQVMDVTARFAGAVVSFVLVAMILLQSSVTLGLVVLVGMPLLVLAIGPLLRPLQHRSAEQRQLMGELANTASDIVTGLRVLRGVGGEEIFHRRYQRESQRARRAGVRVARLQSVLDALQVGLPGLFVVVVVWLGARYAATGQISGGELVAFYGYSAFLMIPLRTATEYANKIIRARVSAARVCRVLAEQRDVADPVDPAAPPPPPATLADARTGVRIEPGRLVALVSEEPERSAALADRLGGCTWEHDRDVTLGGVPLTALAVADVRRRIVVSDTAAGLFSGPLLDGLDIRRRGRDAVGAALAAVSAEDVLAALPGGLDAEVAERGRTFSGGQRQRLVLARALLADPEILVLVEPTSAVDAHTESRIAQRLREHRAGRTTVVTTSSPLLLDAADEVIFIADQRVVDTGTHGELLGRCPSYRDLVTRGVREKEPVR